MRTWGCCLVGLFVATIGWALRPTPADAAPEAEAPALLETSRARIELGRRLFFDPAVSQSGKVSCASCHDPEHGYADPEVVSADEISSTSRHSQTLIDMAHARLLHRDGEFDSVESLVLARLGSELRTGTSSYGHRRQRTPRGDEAVRPDVPMALVLPMETLEREALRLKKAVAVRVEDSGRYARAFQAAFGDARATLPRIARAIGDYCRSIESTTSRVDQYLAGDKTALGASETRGLELFRGRAGCAECHTPKVDPKVGKALFTDGKFHNTGVVDFADLKRKKNRRDLSALGRFLVSRDREDFGKFKTPSLRDVATRAPYMHDGSLETLEDVVRHYARGGNTSHSKFLQKTKDKRIRKLELEDQDVEDLVAFLRALSGLEPARSVPRNFSARAAETTLTFYRNGRPKRNLLVRLQLTGERVLGKPWRGPLELRTNKWGEVTFKPGNRTHVRILSPASPEPIALVPDTCDRAVIHLREPRSVELRLRKPRGNQQFLVLPTRIFADRKDGRRVVFERVARADDDAWAQYQAFVGTRKPFEAEVQGIFASGVEPREGRKPRQLIRTIKLSKGKPADIDFAMNIRR